MSPFNGLGALGQAEEEAKKIEQSLASQSVEYLETWLPTGLAFAVAMGVSPERIKQIYCKIGPVLAQNAKIQAAFSMYATGGCVNNPNLPPIKKPTNWPLIIGVSVGALALVGGAIWYMRRNR